MKQTTWIIGLVVVTLLMNACNFSLSSEILTSLSGDSISSISSLSSETSIPSSSSSSSDEISITSSSSIQSSSTQTYSSLKVLTINDFHGALEEDSYGAKGIGRVGYFIKSEQSKSTQAVVTLASGDMFQGTAISNYYHGQPVIEAMNEIGFDAMTIGNHEFDWGIDAIKAYHDGNEENGEAQFPFLGANIYERSTNQPVDWADPYTIVEKGNLKIGIIGVIGEYLADSISTSIVAPYQFKDPAPIVANYAKELRETYQVDMVIVSVHDANDSLNSELAALPQNQRVDAILNAHSHQYYTRTLRGTSDQIVPIIQSGSSGSYVGEIVFSFNGNIPTYISQRNVSMTSSVSEDITLLGMLQSVLEKIGPIINEVIGVAGEGVDRYTAAHWAADVIRTAFDVDVAMVNIGGIRSVAFPIEFDQPITIAEITQIMPFDNYVKIVTLTGAQLLSIFANDNDGFYTDFVTEVSGSGYTTSVYVNGQALQSNTTYRVATVDYVFDKVEYAFIEGTNIVNSGILLRDLMILDVRTATTLNQGWRPSTGAILPVQVQG